MRSTLDAVDGNRSTSAAMAALNQSNHVPETIDEVSTTNSTAALLAVSNPSMDDLPREILFIIFDFMGWNDLQTFFSRMDTSERVKEEIDIYLKDRFKTHSAQIKQNGLKISPPTLTCMPTVFDYIQSVTVFGGNSKILNCVQPFRNLKKLTHRNLFSSSVSSQNIGDGIIQTLENLEHVEFVANQFYGRDYDKMLQHCQSIKSLTITTNTMNGHQSPYDNVWHTYIYPNLETIHWNHGYTTNRDEFEILLRQNSGIVNLKISRDILDATNFIEDTNLVLDKLGLEFHRSCDAQDFNLICDQVNSLHQNRQYQKLYLTFGNERILKHYIDYVASLHSLHGIILNGEYISELGRLSGLKELHVTSIQDGMEAAKQLPHLKVLSVEEASLDNIRPFIQYCPKLEKIIVEKVPRTTIIGIDNLIRDRENLDNATIVKIYLPEKPYLALKKYSQSSKLVEICRFESFQPDF